MSVLLGLRSFSNAYTKHRGRQKLASELGMSRCIASTAAFNRRQALVSMMTSDPHKCVSDDTQQVCLKSGSLVCTTKAARVVSMPA